MKNNLDILLDVNLKLSVELARVEMPLKDVLSLEIGDSIPLEGQQIGLFANGKLIAHGEIQDNDGNLSLKITKIIEKE